MRPPRVFGPTRLCIIFLLTFITYGVSLTQLNLLCKQRGTLNCFLWTFNSDNDRISTDDQTTTKVLHNCGLSDRGIVPSHGKLIKVRQIKSKKGHLKKLLCTKVILIGPFLGWEEVENTLDISTRVRRQSFTPRGRYRGQTQSQYLAIDRGNGKDEGRAEAHSAADSSRASVSGNSGMGQAQSQSIYDPNCDDCYAKTHNEVENLKRPIGSLTGENAYGPNSGSTWPNLAHNGGYNPTQEQQYIPGQDIPGALGPVQKQVIHGQNAKPANRNDQSTGTGPNGPNAGTNNYRPIDATNNGYYPYGIGGTKFRPGENPGNIGYGPTGSTDGRLLNNYEPNTNGIDNRYRPSEPNGVYGPGLPGGSGVYRGGNPQVSVGSRPDDSIKRNSFDPTINGYRPSASQGGLYMPNNVQSNRNPNGENYLPVHGHQQGDTQTRPGNFVSQSGRPEPTHNQIPAGETNGNDKTGTGNGVPGTVYNPDVRTTGNPVGFGTGQSSIPNTNWPIASGPYQVPGGNVYCCIVPNNGMSGNIYPNTFEAGKGNPIVSGGQYGIPGQIYGTNMPAIIRGTNVPGGQYQPGGAHGTSMPAEQYVPGTTSGSTVPNQYHPSGTGGHPSPGSQYGGGETNYPNGQYIPTSSGNNIMPGGQYGQKLVPGSTGPGGQYIPGTTGGINVPRNQYGPSSTYEPGNKYGPNGASGSSLPGGQYGPVSGTGPLVNGARYGPGGTDGTSAPREQYGTGSGSGSSVPGNQYGPGLSSGSSVPRSQYGPNSGTGSSIPTGQYRPGDSTGISTPGGQYGPGIGRGPSVPEGQYGPDRGSGLALPVGQYGPGVGSGISMPGGQYGPGVSSGTAIPGSQYRPGTGSGIPVPGGQYGPGSSGGTSVPGVQYGPGSSGGTSVPGTQYGPGSSGGTSVPGTQYGPSTTGGTSVPGTQYGPGFDNGSPVTGGQYGPGTVLRTPTPQDQYSRPIIGSGSPVPGGQYSPTSNSGTSVPVSQYGPGSGRGTSGPGSQYGPNTSSGTSSPESQYGPNVSSGTSVPGTQYGPSSGSGTSVPGGQYIPGDMRGTGQYTPGNQYVPGTTSNANVPGGQYQPDKPGVSSAPGSQYGQGVRPGGHYGQNEVGQSITPGGPFRPEGTGGTFPPVGQYGPGSNYSPSPGGQQGSNSQGFYNQGGPGGQNVDYNGVPQNYLDPNTVSADGDDSEAEANVAQSVNGTTASASSKGGNDKGRAQTSVQGTYTGSGSFQAQAQITGENKEAQSEVNGGKKGASSSASGSGRNNKSQANVQLGSETGSVQTQSQSNGVMHSSNSQVQGSVKGGTADAQARGPGSTSSQAQIGFTPYKDEEKSSHDLQKIPFTGGGMASAQSSGRTGQSQSQLHGTFKYGITYNGAAQSGASLDKDAVFPNRLPFEKIDVFDEKDKNINVDKINIDMTETPQSLDYDPTSVESSTIPGTSVIKDKVEIPTTENAIDESMKNSESRYSGHAHIDRHLPDTSNTTYSNGPTLLGSRRSFKTNYGSMPDYEFTTDKEETQPEYDTDVGYEGDGNEASDVEQNEYSNYDEYSRDSPTHQYLQNSNRKGLEVQQTTGGNTQHIILGSLKDHNAEIIQKDTERPDESRVYQPGERVPGTGGYTIPVGFTGSIKSVASKDKTYVVGSKDFPSQAQTVTLTSGKGKVKYAPPSSYGKYVKPKNLRSLQSPKESDSRYVSVSKSVTRDLDSDNNIRKQYSHTYYTKSSSCGYFTFTCTMVSSAEGRKKVCKPKLPTNPDGTPIRC